MKLFEGAVFLIIAGVLLGPIEARNTDGSTGPRCVGNSISRIIDCNPNPMETTAETCERAMKEIGAEKQRSLLWVLMGRLPGGRNASVFCIPAPSGLVK